MVTKKRRQPQPVKQTKQDRERQAAIQQRLDNLMMRRISTRGPQDLMPPGSLQNDKNKE